MEYGGWPAGNCRLEVVPECRAMIYASGCLENMASVVGARSVLKPRRDFSAMAAPYSCLIKRGTLQQQQRRRTKRKSTTALIMANGLTSLDLGPVLSCRVLDF